MADVTLLSIGIALLLAFFSTTAGSLFSDTSRRLQETAALSASTRQDPYDKVKTFWQDQPLDHFNNSDSRTWLMRYKVNNKQFRIGGPMFIILVGAAAIESSSITAGYAYDMAKAHHALLILPEHRYYGQSRVLNDLSNSNLQYLTARQALADLAHLISNIRRKTPNVRLSKVILIGYGYGGSLAVWFKNIYADQLVRGVWASSAPLLAKVDVPDYMQRVGNSIKLAGGTNCYKRIKNGIAEMEQMFGTAHEAELMAMLQLCKGFSRNQFNKRRLFAEIANLIAELVQSSHVGQIDIFCKQIMAEPSDLTAMASLALSGLRAKYAKDSKKCLDLSYIKSAANITYADTPTRQWLYQACNEFGWFATSEGEAQPFGTQFPLAYFTQICGDVFGAKYTDAFIQAQIDLTNAYFGGLNVAGQHIYFSHGQLDAWQAVQKQSEAFNLSGYAHCMDLDSLGESDTMTMRGSKQIVANLLSQWLK